MKIHPLITLLEVMDHFRGGYFALDENYVLLIQECIHLKKVF